SAFALGPATRYSLLATAASPPIQHPTSNIHLPILQPKIHNLKFIIQNPKSATLLGNYEAALKS
ncbi:MAG: hypothetical protein ACKOF3_05735, partial [Spartobacteria bacterium]